MTHAYSCMFTMLNKTISDQLNNYGINYRMTISDFNCLGIIYGCPFPTSGNVSDKVPQKIPGSLAKILKFSMPNMTGRPGYRTMEINGGSSALYLACTPCGSLFCTLFNRGGNRRAFRLPGEGRDHFHCTVEPSPGHIRCRNSKLLTSNDLFWL